MPKEAAPQLTRAPPTSAWGIAAAGLLLRLLLVVRDATVLDRLFVPDDTYYTLGIARGLARGWGPSIDGTQLTNGFQPLIAFLVAPAYWVTDDPVGPLRWAWFVLVLADAASALLLARLAWRATGHQLAAWCACAFWALSPMAIANAMGGLETSLAVVCELGCVEAWCAARERSTRGAWLLTGALAGLALLARVDSVIVLGVLALTNLRATPARAPGWMAWMTLGAGLVVAPWWAYEAVRLGSIVPTSGQAVREQVAEHRARYLTTLGQVGWALGAALEPWFARLVDLRLFFYRQTWLTAVVAPVGTLALVAAVWRARMARPVAGFVTGALALFPFYALYVPAMWFFPRYLAPVHAALALLAAVGIAHLAEVGHRAWPWARNAAALVLAVSCAVDAGYVFARPARTPDEDLHGAKGYGEAARAILDMAPPGAVVGALQSGALSYFADGRNVRVLNLDGVVDDAARAAFHGHRMAAFARARSMTHFADWRWNREAFVRHAGDPTVTDACFVPLGEAPPQPPDRFVLYAFVCR
ncbi:hypothetical protein LVJ94_08390 [Pendulispora rubella]|uniref:Glycosyltransferase RgtA/B/C/D-like domain-containing protein n=1 Tax=Pendulispora rubella TaxID=2741070 RepID=A0ABZ2L8I7_9BACT